MQPEQWQMSKAGWIARISGQLQQQVVIYWVALVLALTLLFAALAYQAASVAPTWSHSQAQQVIAAEKPFPPCPIPPPWIS